MLKRIGLWLCVMSCGLSGAVSGSEILVKNGEKIAYLGDSITARGHSELSGYLSLVKSGLQANGVAVENIPAGVSGHKSNQMLERLERDVIAKAPQWMTLSCGVNDVWHGANGVSLDDYKKNITAIVEKALGADIKVVILTSTPIQEVDNAENQKLAAYNDFLRELAQEKKLPLADLSAAFWQELKHPTYQQQTAKNYLTIDGVHPNVLGDMVIAKGILRAFGLDDEQLKIAEDEWFKTARVNAITATTISIPQFIKLSDLAVEQGKDNVRALQIEMWVKTVNDATK
jgi:lysophospholipase L1-like esterase